MLSEQEEDNGPNRTSKQKKELGVGRRGGGEILTLNPFAGILDSRVIVVDAEYVLHQDNPGGGRGEAKTSEQEQSCNGGVLANS